MKVSATVLSRYLDLPSDPKQLRDLLDDVGIEVKKMVAQGEDTLFTLEFLANRGDHHCYEGIAREVSGRTGGQVCRPEIAALTVGESPVQVQLQSDACLRYTATVLRRTQPEAGLGPLELAPILAADMHSVSPAVDATQLANLELGQPTHAFDADTVVGSIVVRRSRAGEKAWPLFFEHPIDLPEGLLVIADHHKILAIAGVIGCEESKATPQTTRLLLESACFDPVVVRQASRSLGIHTTSSARFERGADPTYPLVGAGRVVYLLEQAGWMRVGSTGQHGDWTDPQRVLSLRTDQASTFLDHRLEPKTLIHRLQRYGFLVQAPPEPQPHTPLKVQVPPHRLWDVEHLADLYEELAKSIGYAAIPVQLPAIDKGTMPSPVEHAKSQIDEIMVGAGFYEVITNGFYGREPLERLRLPTDHPLLTHIETLNAVDRNYSLLKNNALFQALDGLASNIAMRTSQIKTYEWTRTFQRDLTAPNGLCREHHTLWALCNGTDQPPNWSGTLRPADAFYLKGLVEEIAAVRQLNLRFVQPDNQISGPAIADLLHPGRHLIIFANETLVGVLGEVHPEVLAAWRIKRARPCYLELSTDSLVAHSKLRSFAPPSAHQPMVRNLAFTLTGRVAAQDIATHLMSVGPDWLQRVRIVDYFGHKEPLERTITYELAFSTKDIQPTADQVNALCENLINKVQSQFSGVALR